MDDYYWKFPCSVRRKYPRSKTLNPPIPTGSGMIKRHLYLLHEQRNTLNGSVFNMLNEICTNTVLINTKPGHLCVPG